MTTKPTVPGFLANLSLSTLPSCPKREFATYYTPLIPELTRVVPQRPIQQTRLHCEFTKDGCQSIFNPGGGGGRGGRKPIDITPHPIDKDKIVACTVLAMGICTPSLAEGTSSWSKCVDEYVGGCAR